MTQNRKAIALLSGGLDSALAAKIIQDEGVEVIGLHLASPFGCRVEVQKVVENLKIPLVIKAKGEKYLNLVEKPEHGYGRAVNPCIDCRIYMFELAEQVRLEQNADFIITGEVLGQRPMSQQKHAMQLIDRNSEAADRILRPLSAHLFEPTLPEREGWVNREKLFDVRGRSRKIQLQLAEDLGVTEFSAPGGGCLLTEMSFAPRLKDFFAHPHFANADQKLVQSELLRFGRHFRLNPQTKFIIARNSEENSELEARWEKAGATLLTPFKFSGPCALVLGEVSEEVRRTAGEMMLRYSRAQEVEKRIEFCSSEAKGDFVVEKPYSETEMEAIRL